jgi:hypothetical protein
MWCSVWLFIIYQSIFLLRTGFMVFISTFNNISVKLWWSVLLVEETGVPGENQQLVTSHWQTLSHNVVSNTPHCEWDLNSQLVVMIGTDCTGSCKSNYHMITTTMAPLCNWNIVESGNKYHKTCSQNTNYWVSE